MFILEKEYDIQKIFVIQQSLEGPASTLHESLQNKQKRILFLDFLSLKENF